MNRVDQAVLCIIESVEEYTSVESIGGKVGVGEVHIWIFNYVDD